MENIEVEIRSFITEDIFSALLERFKREAKDLGEDQQTTYYFDSEADLRIQKNNTFAKIWLKKGKIHDEHREEIEIRCKKEDFELLEKLFATLGYKVAIKWFRNRHTFGWGDIQVTLDYTKGYGHIIELEKMSIEAEKEKVATYLKTKMAELKIPLTLKAEFDEKYQYYKLHWQELV